MRQFRATIAIGLAISIAAAFLFAFGFADAFELPVRDLALRLLPSRAAQSTVVVAIDERSLRTIGPWPWPRATLAQLVNRAADSGARGVVLDVLLADPRAGDDQLARAMTRLPAIAVSVLDEHGEWLVPAPAIRGAATAAHGNFELDHDGILRRVATTKQSRDRSLTAVPVAAASLITNKPVAIGRAIAPMFRTHPRDIPQISAVDFLSQGAPHTTQGRVVFIGPTALALGDRVLTPVARRHLPDPGVTVHAAATESIVRGEEVRSVPPIVAGLLIGIVCASARSSKLPIVAALYLVAALVLLPATGFALPITSLLACLAIIAILRVIAARNTIAAQFRAHRANEAESKRVLAHELKTPLASMRGLTQLLGRFELSDAERKRVTSLLESEAGKLETMVQSLLDLEKLPLRDFASSTSVIDLGDVVSTRVAFLQASTDRQLVVKSERGILVRADVTLIERVVDNLVGNAIKYSPSDVTVRVHANGTRAFLDVEDQGPGISDAERTRVFDRFYRAASARGTQGLGLGLSLVAEVARWHGGKVSVEGSRFSVEMPKGAS